VEITGQVLRGISRLDGMSVALLRSSLRTNVGSQASWGFP
jgi:hypothetical protein